MEPAPSSATGDCEPELSIMKIDENDEDPLETVEILFEIATLLDTGLDKETLTILVELIEQGIHPQALARVVIELRKELQVVREKEWERAREETRRLSASRVKEPSFV